MENIYHLHQQQILIESLAHYWRERSDYFVGANMFVYFSRRQAENVSRGDLTEYRGPDFFVVLGVDLHKRRTCWVVWEEDGRYPDVILEILSPSTRKVDREVKKQLYAEVFGTEEYYLLDWDTKQLEGYDLLKGVYHPKSPNEQGWLWSDKLGLWIGFWQGSYIHQEETWLRFFNPEGELVLTGEEWAQRALAQEQMALATEQETRKKKRSRAGTRTPTKTASGSRARATSQPPPATRCEHGKVGTIKGFRSEQKVSTLCFTSRVPLDIPKTPPCHPERQRRVSAGGFIEIPRFARNDRQE